MKIKTVLLASLVMCAMFTGLATAQDFQRDFNLPGGAGISIRNVAGNINVAGYDGASIIVAAFKQGRDRDRVAIVDASGDDYINIYVEYPRYGSTDASVEFEIRVPRSVQFDLEDISSVSGDVNITSIAGLIHTQSVSGRIEIRDFVGNANANSVSGDVYAQITQSVGPVNLRFASVSGDVVVQVPADLSAYVDLSTISGSIWTGFPIRFTGRWPLWGRSARGRLGTGAGSLKMSSISGRVCLLANH